MSSEKQLTRVLFDRLQDRLVEEEGVSREMIKWRTIHNRLEEKLAVLTQEIANPDSRYKHTQLTITQWRKNLDSIFTDYISNLLAASFLQDSGTSKAELAAWEGLGIIEVVYRLFDETIQINPFYLSQINTVLISEGRPQLSASATFKEVIGAYLYLRKKEELARKAELVGQAEELSKVKGMIQPDLLREIQQYSQQSTTSHWHKRGKLLRATRYAVVRRRAAEAEWRAFQKRTQHLEDLEEEYDLDFVGGRLKLPNYLAEPTPPETP